MLRVHVPSPGFSPEQHSGCSSSSNSPMASSDSWHVLALPRQDAAALSHVWGDVAEQHTAGDRGAATHGQPPCAHGGGPLMTQKLQLQHPCRALRIELPQQQATGAPGGGAEPTPTARRVLRTLGSDGQYDDVCSWLEQQVSTRQGQQGRLVCASSRSNLDVPLDPEWSCNTSPGTPTPCASSSSGGGSAAAGLPAPAFQLLGLL